MSTAILVTGGSGTLGRKLVRKLIASGHDVRVLSRRDRPGVPPKTPKLPDWPDWYIGDLKTGVGLAKALAGVEVVAHCASVSGADVEAAAQLQIAAGRVGKPHIVYPSLIGADRIEDDFYRDRRAVERLLEEGELPWTVQRTSLFHEHLDGSLRRAARRPVLFVPANTSFQPIAADDVAERMVDLCTPMQAHRMLDLAGPEVIDADDLTHFWLNATRKRRKMIVVRKRGKLYAGYRLGLHLAPDRAVGHQTFADFLAEAYAPKVEEDKPAKAPKEKASKDEAGDKPAKGKRFRRGGDESANARETDDETAN